MNKLEILDLLIFTKAHEELNPIFWNRVQYFSFVNEQTETCLVIRDITDDTKQTTNESLIEFRIVSPSETIWPLEIKEYLWIIKNIFTKNNIIIWDYTYFQIDCLSDFAIFPNWKWFEWVLTFIFKS